jgi:hypothetical protein
LICNRDSIRPVGIEILVQLAFLSPKTNIQQLFQ